MNGFLVDLARRGHGRLVEAESTTDDQPAVAAVPRPTPPSLADLPGEASTDAGGLDEVATNDRAPAPRIEESAASEPAAGLPSPSMETTDPPPPAPVMPAPTVVAAPIAAARSPVAAAPAPAPPSAPVSTATTIAGAVPEGPSVAPPSALPEPTPTPAADRPEVAPPVTAAPAPAPVVPPVSVPQASDATLMPPPNVVPPPAAGEPPAAVVTLDAAPTLVAIPPLPAAVTAPPEVPREDRESRQGTESHDVVALRLPPPAPGQVEPSAHDRDAPHAEPLAGPTPPPLAASITDQRPAMATPAPPSPRAIHDPEAGEMPTTPSRTAVPPLGPATAALHGRSALIDASPPTPQRAPTLLPVAAAPLPAVAEPRPAEFDQPRPNLTEAPLPQRSVHVRIGAVEVRAETPPQPLQIAAVRRPSVTVGFDAYRAIRSHAGWDT